MPKGWIALADAAAQLRMSYNRAYRLVLIGRIIGRKNAGRWFVDVGSLEKFTRQSRRTSQEAGRGGSGAA